MHFSPSKDGAHFSNTEGTRFEHLGGRFWENAAFHKDATPISAKCADWRNPPRTLELWRRSLEISGGTLETWAAQNAGSEFSKVPAAPHSGEMVRILKSSAAFWRNESLPRRKGAAQRGQLLDTPRGGVQGS